MLLRRILIPLCMLILASAACSAGVTQATPITLPPTDVPPATILPTEIPATEIPAPDMPTLPTLTLEQLKNAEVKITGVSGTDATRTVKLTDGKFESNSDHTSADYVSVSMGPQVAYGDLNGDGAQDAAIIIGEGYGGTGDFVSVVAMLNQDGQPVFAGSSGVDDRPKINSLAIQDGEILLDALIHGPNDPFCCAAQPVTKSFRLWDDTLTLTGQTSKIPDGTERTIKIDSPASGSEISGPFTLNGSVTIAPFENTLAYSVFVEGTSDPVEQSAVMVTAAEMGGPGSFTLPLDFTQKGIKGNIRIEISDISAADGSNLAVATLFLTVK